MALALWAAVALGACEEGSSGPTPGLAQAHWVLAPPAALGASAPAPLASPAASGLPSASPPPSLGPSTRPSGSPSPSPVVPSPSLAPASSPPASPAPSPVAEAGASWTALGPGIPAAGPWAVVHGSAADQGDLAALAARYRLLVVDADPVLAAFGPEQIALLKAGGQNRVLSYLNVGAIEVGRSYWKSAPSGLKPAQQLRQLGAYSGYPNERWMDFSDEGWRRLVVEHIAPQLLAQGVDGFLLDNLELLEHPATGANGPCNAACKAGGLRLVAQLRAAFPQAILVNQGAIAQATREAEVDGVAFAACFDGVTREAVFTQGTVTGSAAYATYRLQTSQESLAQLRAWKALPLRPGGHAFWVGVLDYANHCSNTSLARSASDLARAEGFAPSVGDRSAGLRSPCPWPDEVLAPP